VRLYVFDDHRLGAAVGADQLVDITHVLGGHVDPLDRMSALIGGWGDLRPEVEAAIDAGRPLPLARVTLRAPQPRPRKLIAAPVNYRKHQDEMGGDAGVYSGATIKDITTYAGFVKASSSVVGPDGAIEKPFPGRRMDHEAELGVVIGRRGSQIAREDALDHVFGYVPLLDITLRGDEDRSYRKSFDTFTPLGPAIVTADEVADPGVLDIELTVNGEPRQRANTRDLIYDVPRLIELYSEAMTLEPGDVIATGTPEGVGPLEPGDEVVLTIESVGTLVMPVRARALTPA
jgi:2-keto-4-pentenoate hydratase/2-oxohepta-3-ene-1,7-dioic acid hydratase in catechol pathway